MNSVFWNVIGNIQMPEGSSDSEINIQSFLRSWCEKVFGKILAALLIVPEMTPQRRIEGLFGSNVRGKQTQLADVCRGQKSLSLSAVL